MAVALEAPNPIASLPKPLDAEHGRIQAAPVFALRKSRKRKRHEVVVGVDGETLNIYNVQSQQLVTSYPLPPQTYLSTPPCSIVAKDPEQQTVQRHTYAIVRDSAKDKKRRIVHLFETSRTLKRSIGDLVKPQKKQADLTQGDVVALECIPATSNAQADYHVFVAYDNGSIDMYASDLSSPQRFTTGLESGGAVKYATIVEMENTTKGLLKSRGDIATSGQAVCQIVHEDDKVMIRLFALPLNTGEVNGSQRYLLPLLMVCDVPATNAQRTQQCRYELHATSGRLYQLFQGRLTVFDLTGYAPRRESYVGSAEKPIDSFTRLSSTSLVALSASDATIHETTFGTIQASVPLIGTSSRPGEVGRQKHDNTMSTATTSAVTNFSELGLTAILRGVELVTLRTAGRDEGMKRSRARGTLLVDVIGKGLPGSSLYRNASKTQNSQAGARMTAWMKKLNELLCVDNVRALELFVAEEMNIKLGKDNNGALQPGLWFPDTVDVERMNQEKVTILLGRLFKPHKRSTEQSAELVVQARHVLIWAAAAGLLTAFNVEAGWKKILPPIHAMQPGYIVTALQEADDSFELLYELLASSSHMDAAEVLQALKVLIDSFDGSPEGDLMLALPAPLRNNVDDILTNGNTQNSSMSENTVEKASRSAEMEVQRALEALSSGLEIRSEALRLTFGRLQTFPTNVVSETMRAMMTQSEIIFLIHILRIELADGSWTSRYMETGSDVFVDGSKPTTGSFSKDADMSGPLDQAIRAIGRLLNCAMDAIGVSGWLVGQSSNLGTEDVLDSLRAEISAGLEGCYEAGLLALMLKDLERYEYQRAKANQSTAKRKWRDGPGYELHESAADFLLPLGSRVEAPMKLSRGDKRAYAREKHRMVGRYEFDRIRI